MSVEWNGVGLPPVGFECERKFDGHPDEHWSKCLVLWTDGNEMLIRYTDQRFPPSNHFLSAGNLKVTKFRPIRTEAERKREEAIKALSEHFGHGAGLYNVSGLYEKIAAGKIPHITLK